MIKIRFKPEFLSNILLATLFISSHSFQHHLTAFSVQTNTFWQELTSVLTPSLAIYPCLVWKYLPTRLPFISVFSPRIKYILYHKMWVYSVCLGKITWMITLKPNILYQIDESVLWQIVIFRLWCLAANFRADTLRYPSWSVHSMSLPMAT